MKQRLIINLNCIEMGCTSTLIVQSRKVVPLPPETVHAYLDKFPAILIQKIREKFEAQADLNKELSLAAFQLLYADKFDQTMAARLFGYFSDQKGEPIRFRQFMVKYATLLKSEPPVFSKILFEIYKEDVEVEIMRPEQFEIFLKNETARFPQHPSSSSSSLTADQFIEFLSMSRFRLTEYQTQLAITSESDVPFEAISRELLDCDFNDLQLGKEYYLLSNAWYSRWAFYYQEGHSLDRGHTKSTKLLEERSTLGKRRRKRDSLHESASRINESGYLRGNDPGNSLIQQPSTITFEDIEGEFKGELRESLKISSQIKIISEKLWGLLCSLHPAEQAFKRVALNTDTLQYYPKAIYYCQADDKGLIVIESQQIKYLSGSMRAEGLLTNKTDGSYTIFTKNFGEKNWREVETTQLLAEVSLDPRFFIALAHNKSKFLDKHARKQITLQNLQVGDKVYTHFAYLKTHSEASIIGVGESNKFRLHFKGHSYRYQLEVKREDISFGESEAAQNSAKKRNQSIIKGIANIGNTCFMNSIIECLVATPVLDQFLLDFPFNEKKHPIGFGLSRIAKHLLVNEKPNPHQFKKLVDVHMPVFSGFDQHDAQQFLNLLLDKLAEELPEKPTVIDYLFGGVSQARLTCCDCQKTKQIEEKLYILSLPIPEAEYNYYSIVVVPLNSPLKKATFRLHRTATVIDYCAAFESQTGFSKKDFIFCESNYSTLRKLKSELHTNSMQSKRITDVGIVPNIALTAFEKIPARVSNKMLARKERDSPFKDLQLPNQVSIPLGSQTSWTVSKIVQDKNDRDNLHFEYLTTDNEIEHVRIDKSHANESTAKLGTKTIDPTFKKLILRKYNPALKKLEHFGMEFLINLPRWASFDDVIELVQVYLQNLKKKQAKPIKKGEKGDYLIRLLDPSKVRCIFCLKDSVMFNISESDLSPCCDSFDHTVPIAWVSKHKFFWIYVDWIQFSHCNASYCSYIEVDALSKNAQLSKDEQQISLEQCFKLHNQKQKVEMQCDSCKGKWQTLQNQISSMPNIFVLHLKEFRYTTEGHMIKLDLRLRWQEFLDSSKYALCTQGKIYELYALVRHSGNSQSGHYTCMAKRKHPFENKRVWTNFDDDSTDIVKQQQKSIEDAYLLFFKKVDMPTSSLVIYCDLNSP